MKLVKQRGDYDCVLACLEMITGNSKLFSKKFRKEIDDAGGCYSSNVEKALLKSGFEKEDYKIFHLDYNSRSVNDEILWDRVAMLQVPSLNYEDSSHCIVYNKGVILDPSNKQIYKWMRSVTPIRAWVFKG